MNLTLLVSYTLILIEKARSDIVKNKDRILQFTASSEPVPKPYSSSPTQSVNSVGSISSNVPYASSTATVVACKQDMMLSYGLEGYNTARVSTHKYCPMITQNCCTPGDETTSLQLWNNQNKFLVERYYETYLYSIKYLLGFSQEVFRLANDFQNSTNATCKAAAVDYIAMNFNFKITQDVYKSFVISLEKMGDVRRGFYCILCDARTQEKLQDFWSSSNLFYKDRIYFSKEFCRKLVDNTIRASYFTVFYLKRFVENMTQLVNCKTGNTTNLEYDIPFMTKQQVKNCYYFKNKYFFFFCEKYCEQFHLTKANSIFDGDIFELKKFVEHIMATRNSAFYYPSNNLLMDGVGFEEDYLKYYYSEVTKDVVFFRPTTTQVMLDQFKTDVVYYGGMDPWESCENSLYQLVLASAGLIKAIAIGVIVLLSW